MVIYVVITIRKHREVYILYPIFEIVCFFHIKYDTFKYLLNNFKNIFINFFVLNRKRNVLISTSIVTIIPLCFIFDNIDMLYSHIDYNIEYFYTSLTEGINKASNLYDKIILDSFNYPSITLFKNNDYLYSINVKALLYNYNIIEQIYNDYICSAIDPKLLNPEPDSDNINNDPSTSPVSIPNSDNQGSGPNNNSGSNNSGSSNPNSSGSSDSDKPSGSSHPKSPISNKPLEGESCLNSSNSVNPGPDNILNNNKDNKETEPPISRKRKIEMIEEERGYKYPQTQEEKKFEFEKLGEEMIPKREAWEETAKARKAYYERWSERVESLRKQGIDRQTHINEFRECFRSADHQKLVANQEAAKEELENIAKLRSKYAPNNKHYWINYFNIERVYTPEREKLRNEFKSLLEEILSKNKKD